MTEQKTNVFISFSFDSSNKKKEKYEKILEESNYAVNYSEKEDKSHLSDEVIWKDLKNKISGSSVMIVIYSRDFERGQGGKALKVKDSYSNGDTNFQKQGWIYKEVRCALRHSENNRINGAVVVMPDDIHNDLYTPGKCSDKGTSVTNINRTVYPEILKNNYGNKYKKEWKPSCGCCFNIIEDSYIPVIKESVFLADPGSYILLVKEKRNDESNYEIKKETD